MKQQSRRKKKKSQPPSRAAVPPSVNITDDDANAGVHQEKHENKKTVLALMEAFDSVSFVEASLACKEADGDINKAAGILANMTEISDDPYTISVSSGLSGSELTSSSDLASSNSGSSSGEGFMEGNMVNRKGVSRGSNKQKRIVAVAGMVSSVIGKEYAKASPKKENSKANNDLSKEDKEQFLCSMLSDDSDLNMGVVRDVLCQCGYNVEKALDVLLDLSTSSSERLRRDACFKDDEDVDCNENVADRESDCTSNSAESEVFESIWGFDCRNYAQVLTSCEPSSTSSIIDESDIPQTVLESLFKLPKSSLHEPRSMNWKKVAKKLQMLGPAIGSLASSDPVPLQSSYAKGAEYHLLRQPAKQHWDSMKSCYVKSAAAHAKGDWQYASYLSDQAQLQTKLAQKADERASKDIFEVRNKDIENVVTIDLHGQHVKPAMRLLKLHLLFGTYVRSIQILRVITGCGSRRGLGKSILKQSITALLEKEGIKYKEENRGVLLIKIDDSKEYSFLDSDSDTE